MTNIPENMLTNLFENLVTQFVQDNLERIMRAEIDVRRSIYEISHTLGWLAGLILDCIRNFAYNWLVGGADDGVYTKFRIHWAGWRG